MNAIAISLTQCAHSFLDGAVLMSSVVSQEFVCAVTLDLFALVAVLAGAVSLVVPRSRQRRCFLCRNGTR